MKKAKKTKIEVIASKRHIKPLEYHKIVVR